MRTQYAFLKISIESVFLTVPWRVRSSMGLFLILFRALVDRT